MIKCPECNKHTRQYKATCIDNTIKRYNLCKNCQTVFIEVLYSPKVGQSELLEIVPVRLKKKTGTIQTKLM